MTDRLHSPSGWGGLPVTPGRRVLPGADLGHEVPLPPQPPLEDDFPCCTTCQAQQKELPAPPAPYHYPYPGDARIAAGDALIAAGLVDPDDGTVPRWRRGDSVPVWTNPMHVVDTVLAAALPHLQVETRAKVAEEIAGAIENNHGWQTPDQQKALDLAATIARSIGKVDPS